MRKLTSLILAACAATALAAVPASTAATKKIPLTEFVKRANTVCKSIDSKSDKLKEPDDDSTAKQIGAYFKKIQAIFDKGIDQLRAIPLPTTKTSAAKTAVERATRSVDIYNDFLDELGKADTKAKTKTAIDKFEKAIDANAKKEDKAWREVGAKSCVD